MKTPQADHTAVIRTCQIITGALVMGVLFFGAMVTVINFGNPQAGGGFASISVIMAVIGVVLIGVRLVIPSVITNAKCRRLAASAQQDIDTEPAMFEPQLAQLYQTVVIMRGAILEGGAFANLIAYMLEGQWYSLALAGVLVVGIIAGFPTNDAFASWFSDCHRRIDEMHSMRRV